MRSTPYTQSWRAPIGLIHRFPWTLPHEIKKKKKFPTVRVYPVSEERMVWLTPGVLLLCHCLVGKKILRQFSLSLSPKERVKRVKYFPKRERERKWEKVFLVIRSTVSNQSAHSFLFLSFFFLSSIFLTVVVVCWNRGPNPNHYFSSTLSDPKKKLFLSLGFFILFIQIFYWEFFF